MRQRIKTLYEKLPRVKNKIHKTYDVTAEASYNVVFWGVCMVLIYGYLLQYSVRGCDDNFNN